MPLNKTVSESSKNMYSGELWLDYDGQNYYHATVSRCIIREDEVVLEFSGNSEEYRNYQGACNLEKNGVKCKGNAYFQFTGHSKIDATVVAEIEESETEIELHGTWKDNGENAPYLFQLELKKCV
jgi:hypothetical protein